MWVTGPAGFVADLVTAFGGIDTVLLLVALGAVLVILAVVYRSPILPFIVILTAVLALTLAGLVVYELAAADVLTLNGQSQGILSILVVGAAVDYSLLVVARYREELRLVRSTTTALRRAVRASVEPIAASAGTVVAGLLCLLLSDLSSNRSLGPVAAIGIAAAFVAALTLLPALLLVAGQRSRALFWPRMPRYDADHAAHEAAAAEASPESEDRVSIDGHGVWSRVASFVGRHDRRVWIVTALVLAACAAFVPTLDAEGTGDSEVFLADVDSVAGEALTAHFEGVSAQPATVIAPEADLDAVVTAAEGTDGVAAATPVTDQPAVAPGAPAQGDPLVVVDGQVRVDVTTEAPSDSQEAVQTVSALRDAVHEVSPEAVVGGAAAERLDTQLAGQRDLRVIVPVVLVVILLILVLLLRSVLAPVLLMLANVLSFGAALGVAALVFNHVLDFPGADPAVPLYAFCFLVALGVDYSIFLMTRVREESLRVGTRRGVLRGLAVTGSVITSAGVVLAATFAALGIIRCSSSPSSRSSSRSASSSTPSWCGRSSCPPSCTTSVVAPGGRAPSGVWTADRGARSARRERLGGAVRQHARHRLGLRRRDRELVGRLHGDLPGDVRAPERVVRGSQADASRAPFDWFAGPSDASRLRGSFANSRRVSSSQARAPLRHASSRGTTWSIWTAALVALPRRKSIVSPVYGSSKVPVRTSQTSPRVEKVRSARSRADVVAGVAPVAVDVGPRRTEQRALVAGVRPGALDLEPGEGLEARSRRPARGRCPPRRTAG